MIVVLDSSILVRDFQMRSAPFQVLFGAFRELENLRVVVPEVVLDETTAKLREAIADAFKKDRQAADALARLLGTEREEKREPAELTLQDYCRLCLRNRLSSAGCELAPYPEATHREIVDRALARKAPFSSKGGYRDYLIWLATLKLASESVEEVILVTANTRDFFHGPDMHPDLKADLSPDMNLKIVNSLESFNTTCLRPRLEVVSGISRALEDGALKAELESNLGELLEYESEYFELDELAGFSDEQGRSRVRRVSVEKVYASEAVQLADGKVWVQFDATGQIELDITTRTEDFSGRHDAISALGRDAEPGEWNWDESFHAEVNGSLIVDPAEQTIEQVGIEAVDISGSKFDVDQKIVGPW